MVANPEFSIYSLAVAVFHLASMQQTYHCGGGEIEPFAAASHALNFCSSPADRAIHSLPRDISRTEPDQLIAELEVGQTADAIDVIIGGPPCQALAEVGRAKLREVASHPEAFLQDPRSNLYLKYLRLY